MTGSVFGIHVGNSNACLAVHRDGRCEVVANDAGDRVTPTHVAFNDACKEVVVGLTAKQNRFRNAKATVTKNKILLSGVYKPDQSMPYAKIVCENEVYKHNIQCDGKVLNATPHEIYNYILRYIHDIAESHTVDDVKNTVLTVPEYFTEEQREAAIVTGRKAGFNVVQVISEPTAACLAYNIGQSDPSSPPEICMVFRVGGSGMDATLVRSIGGIFTVIKSVHEDIGGNLLTDLMIRYLAEEFLRRYKADPRDSQRAYHKLETNAENVKHVLSTLDTANCYIESLHEGIDFSLNVTRARFDNELGKILPKFLEPVHRALKEGGVDANDVTKLVLCGGSCRIPKVQNAVSSLLKNAEVLNSISPDEVIAFGAASEASLLNNSAQNFKTKVSLQATSADIFFIFNDGQSELLIPKLTPIPVRRSHHFTSLECDNILVKIHLNSDDGKTITLGELTLKNLDKDCKISLSAHIYRDGNLHLALTDKKTNNCDEITIKAHGD